MVPCIFIGNMQEIVVCTVTRYTHLSRKYDRIVNKLIVLHIDHVLVGCEWHDVN